MATVKIDKFDLTVEAHKAIIAAINLFGASKQNFGDWSEKTSQTTRITCSSQDKTIAYFDSTTLTTHLASWSIVPEKFIDNLPNMNSTLASESSIPQSDILDSSFAKSSHVILPADLKKFTSNSDFSRFNDQVQSLMDLNQDCKDKQLFNVLISYLSDDVRSMVRKETTTENVMKKLQTIFKQKKSPNDYLAEIFQINIHENSIANVWKKYIALFPETESLWGNADVQLLSLFKSLLKNTELVPWNTIDSEEKMQIWILNHGKDKFVRNKNPSNKPSLQKKSSNFERKHNVPKDEKKEAKETKHFVSQKKFVTSANKGDINRVENQTLIKSALGDILFHGSTTAYLPACVDAGADLEIISQNMVNKLSPKMEPCNVTLKNFRGEEHVEKKCTFLDVKYLDQWKTLKFIVIKEPNVLILGKPFLNDFGLLTNGEEIFKITPSPLPQKQSIFQKEN